MGSQADGSDGALELQCPICYGCEASDELATLVCGHVFHASCLAKCLAHKAVCPSCRPGGRDAAAHPKCPCKTGQPIRLYNMQRHHCSSGTAGRAARSPLPAGSASPALVAIAMAERRAAGAREERLREALEEERRKVAGLEVEVGALGGTLGRVCCGAWENRRPRAEERGQLASAREAVTPDQCRPHDRAERRKLRLASQELEHKVATARLADDKARVEVRERELSDELARTRTALHNTRMDLEKCRTTVNERDMVVMRLKREVAVQRSKAGGAAAPQPRELAELLGEHKEDWQVVYTLKVEDLRRAQEAAAGLQAALTRALLDGDTRVTAERLAGAERIKAVSQERDEWKREVMNLEFKLNEVKASVWQQQRPQQRQQGAAGRPPAIPGPGPGAGPGGGGAAGSLPASAPSGGVYGRASGGGGGGSLIVEGPDGRGGTTRFPLASSYAHNAARM
ncbi:hypothetical protein TSOC_001229, partial [Tetrabaena socialis]